MDTITTPFKSSAVRAFQSVFESPNWVMNVVWLTVSALAQTIYVGQIALLGWGADQIAMRSGRPENPLPDIDSNRLGDYIGRGLWPFCVYFVVQFTASLLVCIPFFFFVFAGVFTGRPWAMLALIPLGFLAILFLCLVTTPFVIRSMANQSFTESFDFAWAYEFVGIMFWEILRGSLAFAILALGVGLLGAITCIGVFPAAGIINGAGMNLLAQWYEVFLDRGGEPVAVRDPIVDATIV